MPLISILPSPPQPVKQFTWPSVVRDIRCSGYSILTYLLVKPEIWASKSIYERRRSFVHFIFRVFLVIFINPFFINSYEIKNFILFFTFWSWLSDIMTPGEGWVSRKIFIGSDFSSNKILDLPYIRQVTS
jgi:hypothetical protein